MTVFERAALLIVAVLAACARGVAAGNPATVLVIVNDNSPVSKAIGDYYVQRRSIPKANVCSIKTSVEETVTRDLYEREISGPLATCLKSRSLVEQVLYLVTTAGVPLRIKGRVAQDGDNASVDSELALLYSVIHGRTPALNGAVENPFYRQRDARFERPRFPIYLVTRLAAYDLEGAKALIDRSLQARNVGKFVIDCRSDKDESGDAWLRNAAILIPSNRLVFDESHRVLAGEKGVIGYASWGSNDSNRKQRRLGFEWLPGAIMTEFVSSNARTFRPPPAAWNISTWKTPRLWFAGSPQTLITDYLAEGATGAAGHIDEPYLGLSPRPDYLLPAWYSGRNLAESYYLSIPALSWQNVVVGDPLCSLGPPGS